MANTDKFEMIAGMYDTLENGKDPSKGVLVLAANMM